MSFFALKLGSMHELFINQLRSLYDMELRLVEAFPDLIAGASTPSVKAALQEHLTETDEQIRRLERAMDDLALKRKRETSDAMKGFLDGAREVLRSSGDGSVRDAALIAALQGIEHCEVAAYGAARTWALHLGLQDIAELLQQSLDEESSADRRLTELAEDGINALATYASRDAGRLRQEH
jgi:ferritin-like metal-binding protein YciE